MPLYRIYPRKNDWKSEGPIIPTADQDEDVGSASETTKSIVERAAVLAEKYAKQYSIQRDDSTDELLKSVHAQREARKKQLLSRKNQEAEDGDSGRSTPDHLKNYPGTVGTDNNEAKDENKENISTNLTGDNDNSKRLRTFSETLKLLDDDILDELDVKTVKT